MFKEYLGDSVYAEMNGQMIRLFTLYDKELPNEIILEPEVYRALIAWKNRVDLFITKKDKLTPPP